MQINRDSYLQEIINRKHNRMVKVITGIRRCGKSYLLFELFNQHLLYSGVDADHIIKIALDDYQNRNYRQPDYAIANIKDKMADDSQYYILLDEVQMMDSFVEVLNSLSKISNVDIYVTGSNSKFLSKDILTEFRGRGDQIYVMPLSFSEYFSICNTDVTDAWLDYYTYGGLPALVLMNSEKQKVDYLTNLFVETYIKDLVERNNIKHESELDELINILASSIGSLTNPTKLSDTFKSVKKVDISSNTIKSYIDYLEDCFLVKKAMRYNIKGKKYISTPFKYFFTDVGLRNAKLSFRQQEENHIMENIIFNELTKRGYAVDVGIVEINEKQCPNKYVRKSLEVDFIANRGNKKYYIQSAFSMPTIEKQQQEKKSLENINDSFKKIIIVKDKIKPHIDNNGIVTISIFDFLLNDNSLEL